MSKWLMCGAVVVALGAGAAALKDYCWRSRSAAVASIRPESEPAETGMWTQQAPKIMPGAQAFPLSSELKALEEAQAAQEPIMTKPEALRAMPEVAMTLTMTGGAEESEVGVTGAPRPDVETRRMPYAEEDGEFFELVRAMRETPGGGIWDFTPRHVRQSAALSWRGLARWALGLGDRAMAGAEESEEPPLLDPELPDDHHPPHCPFGGYCPYPGPYRYVTPR